MGAALRVTAPNALPWDIAIGSPGWWRTPIPTAIAFISEWTGYLVDVVSHQILFEVGGVVRITEDEQHNLLLLVSEGSITAVGPDGVAWCSENVAVDDLKVVAIDERSIVCSGFVGGDRPTQIVLNPRDGKPVAFE
ncbi:hypothetical protein BH09ACT4_BH09ACT4_15700 [soil metagenome]